MMSLLRCNSMKLPCLPFLTMAVNSSPTSHPAPFGSRLAFGLSSGLMPKVPSGTVSWQLFGVVLFFLIFMFPHSDATPPPTQPLKLTCLWLGATMTTTNRQPPTTTAKTQGPSRQLAPLYRALSTKTEKTGGFFTSPSVYIGYPVVFPKLSEFYGWLYLCFRQRLSAKPTTALNSEKSLSSVVKNGNKKTH